MSISSARRAFAFEADLYISRVYKRALSRYSTRSTVSLTSSVTSSIGCSLLSGLSLADISHISVLSLPIYSFEVSNSKCYSFKTNTQDRFETTSDDSGSTTSDFIVAEIQTGTMKVHDQRNTRNSMVGSLSTRKFFRSRPSEVRMGRNI